MVMVGAVVTIGVGLGMLVESDQVPGLVWYAVPITLLGLLLAVLWIRDRGRPLPPLPGAPEEPPAVPLRPGIPVALLALWGVAVVLFALWAKRL